MLIDAPATTMLPVVDVTRARKFYEQTLGLKFDKTLSNGCVVFALNGSTLGLYPRPTPSTADHTALSFEVSKLGRRGHEIGFLVPQIPTVTNQSGLNSNKQHRVSRNYDFTTWIPAWI